MRHVVNALRGAIKGCGAMKTKRKNGMKENAMNKHLVHHAVIHRERQLCYIIQAGQHSFHTGSVSHFSSTTDGLYPCQPVRYFPVLNIVLE